MKIVYMGTPEIAKVCLEKLYTEGFDIAAVYTKPDTPKNRGMKLIPWGCRWCSRRRSKTTR